PQAPPRGGAAARGGAVDRRANLPAPQASRGRARELSRHWKPRLFRSVHTIENDSQFRLADEPTWLLHCRARGRTTMRPNRIVPLLAVIASSSPALHAQDAKLDELEKKVQGLQQQ